jgi:hypothetical protein
MQTHSCPSQKHTLPKKVSEKKVSNIRAKQKQIKSQNQMQKEEKYEYHVYRSLFQEMLRIPIAFLSKLQSPFLPIPNGILESPRNLHERRIIPHPSQ